VTAVKPVKPFEGPRELERSQAALQIQRLVRGAQARKHIAHTRQALVTRALSSHSSHSSSGNVHSFQRTDSFKRALANEIHAAGGGAGGALETAQIAAAAEENKTGHQSQDQSVGDKEHEKNVGGYAVIKKSSLSKSPRALNKADSSDRAASSIVSFSADNQRQFDQSEEGGDRQDRQVRRFDLLSNSVVQCIAVC